MKYIYSALMLVGGITVVGGISALIGYIIAKLQDFEISIDVRSIKYRKFKMIMQEKILPYVLFIAIIILLLVLLVTSYIVILDIF